MTADPDFDRPGLNDLVTPFIFVKHGDPDPVAWKQAHPGWVSFPATFIPHKRPPPKWTILNGRRWPLDKRGQPWPRSRFGQPMCPLDEFPPGVPAPGTQGKQQAWEAEAVREAVRLVGTGELTTEWFLAEGARHRASARRERRLARPRRRRSGIRSRTRWRQCGPTRSTGSTKPALCARRSPTPTAPA